MKLNKKNNIKLILLPILAILSLIPIKVQAFLDFCFPLTFTILSFVLGWPSMVIYEFFPKKLSEQILDKGFSGMFVIGFAVDLVVILLLGYLMDKRKNTVNLPFNKRYIFRIPFYFILAIILLLGLMFVDPTCKLT